SRDFQFVTKIFERLKQLVCAVIPFLAIFAQRFADNLLKLSGSVLDVTRERRRFLFKNPRHRLSWCVAREWRMPRYHFVKDYAEIPEVGALINLPAARLFRRHIANGSQYRPQIGLSECHRSCPVRRSHWHAEGRLGDRRRLGEGGFGKLCNPKVEHFHVSVPPEHDVLRLDVAMDNPSFMGGSERACHLDGDVNSFTDLHSPAHQTLPQCLAFDQFAGYVMSGVMLADLVNRQDIWMIKPNYRPRFSLKPLQALRIAGKAHGQEFERGFAARCHVGGQIDFAHPAGADPFRKFVVADRLADE